MCIVLGQFRKIASSMKLIFSLVFLASVTGQNYWVYSMKSFKNGKLIKVFSQVCFNFNLLVSSPSVRDVPT